MRKKIVAGNWKMNKSYAEAIDLVNQISKLDYDLNTNLLIIPPFIYIADIIKLLEKSTIEVGAQNCSEKNNGAFTGEISTEMLKNIGCKYVLVGHSERRAYFYEDNEIIANKIKKLLLSNLTPIFCCGEQLSERENNNHFKLIETQIKEGLFCLDETKIANCIIAYEPVWAIGTGKTATAIQAQEMHAFIRNLLAEKYSKNIAENITILYGGSCKPSNTKELFAQADIDGGLIGGAALNATDFIAIANSF